MNRFIFLLIVISILGDCKAQNVSLDSISDYYVQIISRQFDEHHFTDTHYEFYNKSTYHSDVSFESGFLFSCKWIEYDQRAIGGEHAILVVFSNIYQSQEAYCSDLKEMLSYIATRKKKCNLTDINLELPMELSISISSMLYKEEGLLRQNHAKYIKNPQHENELIKQELKKSPLYSQIDSMLAKYEMKIINIQIIEPTLLYSKEKLEKSIPQHTDCSLPEYVLGLHINLTVDHH